MMHLFVGKHVSAFAIAALLAVALSNNWPHIVRYWKGPPKASDWMEVTQIYVPNHMRGTNPKIVYDRTIHKSFTANWLVEVQRLDSGKPVQRCSGHGRASYDPEEGLPASGVTWKWYVGADCPVPPGAYRLQTTWDIETTPDGPKVRLVNISNVFKIYPPISVGAPSR